MPKSYLLIRIAHFFYDLMNGQKLLEWLAYPIFLVVQDEGQGHSIEDALYLLWVIVNFQVLEQTVLRSDFMVSLDMIHQLLQTMLTYRVKVDPAGSRLPFKVEKTVDLIVCSFPSRKHHSILHDRLAAPTLNEDPGYQLRVVARPDYILQWLALILFVPILGYFRIFL